jgi:general secretion pathway protein C
MTIEAKWPDFTNFDNERILTVINQVLPRWVTLILVIAISWHLTKLIWMLIPGSPMGDSPILTPSQVTAIATPRLRANVQVIAATHIFGTTNDKEAVTETVPTVIDKNLAETRQNLSLKGTITAIQPNEGLAIMEDNHNEEKVYGIRDTVVPGTTLHTVYLDRVVLNEGGTLKALKLPKAFLQSAAVIRRNITSVNRTSNRNRNIQIAVSQNILKLAEIVRPTPYTVAGKMQGYHVYPGSDRKQFAALGLRPGDLIKDIGGVALTDPQQAMQVFQSLGETNQVSVTIERNGQAQTLTLKTSQLDLGKK